MPGLTTPSGAPVGAVLGFLKALRRMQRHLQPDRAAVVWDVGLPARRTALQPAYKAQRAEMPEDLDAQLPLLRELITLIGFCSVSLPDTEADDLMASYAHAAVEKGWEVVLATVDKDLFQILAPNVRIYSTHKNDLATPKDTHALLDAEAVRRKWGIAPGQLRDYLSIVGDASDNIPGVQGIGPKGAAALLNACGSLEAVFADPNRVESVKTREKLLSARAQLEQNQEMVRLDLNLTLPVSVEALHIAPDYGPLLKALQEAGLRSLHEEMSQEAGKTDLPSQAELFT